MQASEDSDLKSLPSRGKGRDANVTKSAASTLAQDSPSEVRKYQQRLPPPPNRHPPTHVPTAGLFFWSRNQTPRYLFQSLTHHRTSFHRIHGLSLNIATNRVFTTSQQWNLICRGKPGHWGVSAKTTDVESRCSEDASITQNLLWHPPLPHPVFHQSRSQRVKVIGLVS